MQQLKITLPWHGCRGLLFSPAALLTQDRDSAGNDPEAATHHLGWGLSVVRKQIPLVPKERASSLLPEPLKAEMITTSRWNPEGTSVDGVHDLSCSFTFSWLVYQPCFSPTVAPPSICKQPFELSLPVFLGHPVSNFLSTSLQLKVQSRSHSGHFIWELYHRNAHWHSVSGCVGNSENLGFYFQIHPQLHQALPFS